MVFPFFTFANLIVLYPGAGRTDHPGIREEDSGLQNRKGRWPEGTENPYYLQLHRGNRHPRTGRKNGIAAFHDYADSFREKQIPNLGPLQGPRDDNFYSSSTSESTEAMATTLSLSFKLISLTP